MLALLMTATCACALETCETQTHECWGGQHPLQPTTAMSFPLQLISQAVMFVATAWASHWFQDAPSKDEPTLLLVRVHQFSRGVLTLTLSLPSG